MRTLDVIMANQLGDDPVAMAVWERDRRVDYPHRARGAAAPAAPLPAAGTSLEKGATS